jgi:hypothetical protein
MNRMNPENKKVMIAILDYSAMKKYVMEDETDTEKILNKHMNKKHRKRQSLNVFEAMVLRDHAEEGVKLKEDFCD